MGLTICLPQERFHRYAEALRAAGAELRYGDLSGCGALLLPGGGDIDPATTDRRTAVPPISTTSGTSWSSACCGKRSRGGCPCSASAAAASW